MKYYEGDLEIKDDPTGLFDPGDLIECLDPAPGSKLTMNGIYEVHRETEIFDAQYLQIEKNGDYHLADRFILIHRGNRYWSDLVATVLVICVAIGFIFYTWYIGI